MKVDLSPRIIRRVWQKALYLEQWRLLYALATSCRPFADSSPDAAAPQVLGRSAHRARQWALLHRRGVSSGAGRPHMVLEMDEHGNAPRRQGVDRPWHLSYPFVFAWQGGYFMIPESSSNRTIALKNAWNSPRWWRFRMNLMEGVDAVDSTLPVATACGGCSPARRCFTPLPNCTFSAPIAPSRAWRPHPLNPGRRFRKDARAGCGAIASCCVRRKTARRHAAAVD